MTSLMASRADRRGSQPSSAWMRSEETSGVSSPTSSQLGSSDAAAARTPRRTPGRRWRGVPAPPVHLSQRRSAARPARARLRRCTRRPRRAIRERGDRPRPHHARALPGSGVPGHRATQVGVPHATAAPARAARRRGGAARSRTHVGRSTRVAGERRAADRGAARRHRAGARRPPCARCRLSSGSRSAATTRRRGGPWAPSSRRRPRTRLRAAARRLPSPRRVRDASRARSCARADLDLWRAGSPTRDAPLRRLPRRHRAGRRVRRRPVRRL